MKLPICVIDAQTGTLCKKCKSLYREGKINDLDIELSKLLVQLAKGNKNLKKVELYSVIELKDIVLLVTRKKDIDVLKSPEVMDGIRSIVNKEIRFLERTNDPKRLVESLIAPIPVQNVTTVFIPPFSDKEYKIEIERKYKDELPIPESVLIQTVSTVLNTEAYIEYV